MQTFTLTNTLHFHEQAHQLVYSLTMQPCMAEECAHAQVYGIRAQLLRDDEVLDDATVQDVTSSRDRAVRLMEFLNLHAVTPCTLKDVIEDLLADAGTDVACG